MDYGAMLVWPDGSGDPTEADMTQPDFADDMWPTWRALLSAGEPLEDGLRAKGCGALLVCTMEGMDAGSVQWTSPDDLVAAAEKLKALIRAQDPVGKESVSIYAYAVGDDDSAAAQPLMLRDLDVVVAKAKWAKARGQQRITFELTAS